MEESNLKSDAISNTEAKKSWSTEEEMALKLGVLKYGVGNWKFIQEDPEFNKCLNSRSDVELQEKWQNMNAEASIPQPAIPDHLNVESNQIAESKQSPKRKISEMQSEAVVDAEAESKAKHKIEAEAETEAEADVEEKSEAEASVGAEAESKAEDKIEAEAEADVEEKSEAEALVDAKAESKAEDKIEAEAEADVEEKSEAEALVDAEAESKAEDKIEADAETEVEANAEKDSETEVEAKIEEKKQNEKTEVSIPKAAIQEKEISVVEVVAGRFKIKSEKVIDDEKISGLIAGLEKNDPEHPGYCKELEKLLECDEKADEILAITNNIMDRPLEDYESSSSS